MYDMKELQPIFAVLKSVGGVLMINVCVSRNR